MTDFRFLHASDIHLDSPLVGLAEVEGRTAARIREAPRAAFEALVNTSIQEAVDFLVIAGDLYDGKWRHYGTGLFFVEQMGRLNNANIPVYVLHGNHDAENVMTGSLTLPENVSVFNARTPQSFRIKKLNVALHGQSFQERAVTKNLVHDYPAGIEGAFNIGVLHTAMGGAANHDNYAPCRVEELVGKGYDYWALGHVHQRKVVRKHPHVVYPGNIQGRSVRESGPKGASFVTVTDERVADVTPMTFDVVRWSVLEIDISGTTSMDDVIESVRTALLHEIMNTEGRLLVARIVLQGRTEIHSQLVVEQVRLTAEARSVALGFGAEVAWVERVQLNSAPAIDATLSSEHADTIGELQRILKEAIGDDELLLTMSKHMAQVVAKLPPKLRDECEDEILQSAVDKDYKTLVDKVVPYLCDHLITEEID